MPERDIGRCPICGVSFVRQEKHQYYCTDACENKYKTRTRVFKKNCKFCKKPFETEMMHQIYCCKACGIDKSNDDSKKLRKEAKWLESAKEWVKNFRLKKSNS